jgi:hypothetical protein
MKLWIGILFVLVTQPAWGATSYLELSVTDTQDRPLNGVALSLAGPETVAHTSAGGVRLPLPPNIVPGTRVSLQVHDKQWVMISPWNGEVVVPAAGQGAVAVILAKRGDKESLASSDALHAIAERVLSGLAAAQRSRDSLSEAERRTVLSHEAEEFGFTSSEIDRALRGLGAAPANLEDKRLIGRYLQNFPKPVIIEGNVGTLNVTIQQAAPSFSLEGTLEQLGIGSHATIAVHSTPAEALADARCAWTITPADVLRTTTSDGACRIDVVMPAVPLSDRGSVIPGNVSVRIEKNGALADTLALRGNLRNGLMIDALADSTTLSPSKSIHARVIRHGTSDPVPADFDCSWNFGEAANLRWVAATKNGCQGSIEYKPEEEWDPQEGMKYGFELKAKGTISIPVHLEYKGLAVNESTSVVTLALFDPRDPDEIIATFQERYAEQLSGRPTREIAPLRDLNEKTVTLGLRRQSDRWDIVARYTGPVPTTLKGPLNEYGGLLRTYFSTDATTYDRSDLSFAPGSHSLQELARIKQLWVKFGSAMTGRIGPPFQLTFDFDHAIRQELTNAWKAMSNDEQLEVGCYGLVSGGWSPYVHGQNNEYLAIIDEAGVARDETALWHSHRYDARLDYVFDEKIERLKAPAGPTNYLTRIRFHDGTTETFSCKGRSDLAQMQKWVHYYRLTRSTKSAATWPEAIEIWVHGKWDIGVDVNRSFSAARVSTNGKDFTTFEPDREFHVSEPADGHLIIRFVSETGDEIEYRGVVDLAGQTYSSLKQNLFDEGTFACRNDRSKEVRCGFRPTQRHGVDYLKSEDVLPVVRSVTFGCARDRMDQSDRFEDLRKAKRPYDEFLFAIPRSCETVYARFVLEDGSQTSVMIAPVVANR